MEQETEQNNPNNLVVPIRTLYFLNGATLALPSTAFMAIVNDVVDMPLDLLAAHGAVAFMPFSFKPAYSYLSTSMCERGYISMPMLMASLLAMSGIVTFLTGLIPKDGVTLCFLVAFIRGITIAFPEFLLGTFLVKQARKCSPCLEQSVLPNNRDVTLNIENESHQSIDNFEKLASIYQSQASMYRNLGSLIASIVSIVIYFLIGRDSLSLRTIRILLLATGLLPIIAASIVLRNEWITEGYNEDVSTSNVVYKGIRDNDLNTESTLQLVDTSDDLALGLDVRKEGEIENVSHLSEGLENSSRAEFSLCDRNLMILFQILLIWVGLQSILTRTYLSKIVWELVLGLLVCALLYIVLKIIAQKEKSMFQQGIVIYLILKHAIPDISFIWSSYTFFLFESNPAILQILSVLSSVGVVVGSGIYSKHLARWEIKKTVKVTTLVSSVVILLHIQLANKWKNVGNLNNVTISTVIVLGFFSAASFEAEFIPSVIIATAALQISDKKIFNDTNSNSVPERTKNDDAMDSLQYGSYISFIDFGSQVGAWISIPLINMFEISRDDWSPLLYILVIYSFLKILSLTLLNLL